jgi:hypothetical protein
MNKTTKPMIYHILLKKSKNHNVGSDKSNKKIIKLIFIFITVIAFR